MKCNRLGTFGIDEKHICFVCGKEFSPGNALSCEKCNWKKCTNNHCGCDVLPETKEVLDKFYDLFCEPHNYSIETKKALFRMLNVYYKYCKNCLK